MNGLTILFGGILAIAGLGLAGSVIYQWRRWRQRRALERLEERHR